MRPIVKCCAAAGLLASGVLAVACETAKSSNPLSPSVAGPIPGVTISAPKLLEPGVGWRISTAQQPLTLLLENASTTGVRPLNYTFEIATDSEFRGLVFTREGVAQGEGGRTSLRLPDPLGSDRTYYWRARAYDGANTGPFAAPVHFNVFTPVVIEPPIPTAPVGGVTTTTTRPVFSSRNAARSGPAGALSYAFQISSNDSFSAQVALVTVSEMPNETFFTLGQDLGYGQQYFWRVRAHDPTTQGPWSTVQSFKTPAAPPPPPPPPPPPSPTPTPTPSPAPSGGNRTPDPPPGQRLPLPNMYHIVQEVANAHPNALRNSCQESGGTWEFMDRVVDRLRQFDTRWGYNWKRGNVGDPSKDVVDYHWGRGPDEGSTEVYIIDIIVGHCGSNPGPNWNDVTDVTYNSGTIGRWTGRGRF